MVLPNFGNLLISLRSNKSEYIKISPVTVPTTKDP